MKTTRAILILFLLWTGVFAIATVLQPRVSGWTNRQQSDSALKLLLGESRRMFANHFFVKADISFHSGYYPSIFDQARQSEEKENAVAHGGEHEEQQHEEETGFLGKPTDWIDRFGRHFRVTQHSHLQGGNTREILPWLKISAELDPHRIETYTTAAYWLRENLGKVDEAEQFLREGLRANPDSYEILFELGLGYEKSHDTARARNIWALALRRWHEREDHEKEPNIKAFHDIAVKLANLEEHEGNYAKAIEWLQLVKPHSPNPAAVQKRIEEAQDKLAKNLPPPSH